MPGTYHIRNAEPHELLLVGKLLVDVYTQLEGFPRETDQPAYYKMLGNVGELTLNPDTEVLVAIGGDRVVGAVVYFGDMKYYGSGGTATKEKNASGIRLLAVQHAYRGKGIGKLLTIECIAKAKRKGHLQVILHTTRAMEPAWKMYESLGFKRSMDLDFMQGQLPVFGFRLLL